MIKKYIWLNPIVEAMLRENWFAVEKLLEERGYTIVTCTSGAPRVREAYQYHVKKAIKKPVIDARCPMIIERIGEKYPQLVENIAPIPPILVACTEDLYIRYIEPDPKAATLTVITPCILLAEKGILVFGEKVCFITWIQFAKEMGLGDYPQLQESPVPPGFFNGLNLSVLEASGNRRIESILELACAGLLPEEIMLLELLYCEEGCHRGDGV